MRYKKLLAAVAAILLLLCICLPLSGCGTNDEAIHTLDDLHGKRIGIITGSAYDTLIEGMYPDSEFVYLNGLASAIPALQARKVDCFAADEPWSRYMAQTVTTMTHVGEKILDEDYGIVFQKNPHGAALRDEFNAFLAGFSDEDIAEIQEAWFSPDASRHPVIDYSLLTAERGTLAIVLDSSNLPFEMLENGHYAGYDVDLLYRFCKSAGYGMKISDSPIGALIPAVNAGAFDIACASFSITEERKQSVYFSEPLYRGGIVICIRTEETQDEFSIAGVFSGLVESFRKTFLKESRWKSFASGIGVTVMITVLSLLFGTALGFGIYLLSRSGGKVMARILRVCDYIVTGLPEVLFLMILFYIVFSKSSLSGFWIAVFGFSIIAMFNVISMLNAGVATVDVGQTEGFLALGYSPTFGFFRVILPQALEQALPSYFDYSAALLRATSIVGYLTVQDLTRVSDIIRSRTYEAFFPLISTTVIYFVLTALLVRALVFLQKKIMPIRRSGDQYLQGVTQEEKSEKN